VKRIAIPSAGTRVLPVLILLAAGLLAIAGCTGTAPPEQGSRPAVTTPAGLPPYMVHVAGEDHGAIILVGRSTCPWCMKTKDLLANLSVGYYWIDLNTLNDAETAQVMDALGVCGPTNSVPVLVIHGDRCIIGYNETLIREVLK
jgi:glutaredoxin